MNLENMPLLADLPDSLQSFVIRLLALAIALVLIVLLRRALTYALVRPLKKWTSQTGREQDDMVLEAVIPSMRYFVIAAAILVSVAILGTHDVIRTFGENFARMLVIIGIVSLFMRLTDLFLPTSTRLFAMTGLHIQDRLLPFLRTTIKVLLIAVGVVVVLQVWGYDANGLIAGLGIGGLALSLAAQDSAANIFGFVAIVGDRPFDVGDYIVTPDVEGLVEHVGVRSTRVRRLDQALVTVPNRKLADSAVLNWSKLSKRRIDMLLGVTYDASSDDMRVLVHRIREMLLARETVEEDSIVVYFVDFGDSSLNILVRSYVLLPDWGEFTAEKEQIYLAIMDIVSELSMSVAFPSTSLYIENLPDLALNVEAARRQMNVRGASEASDENPRLSPRERALLDEKGKAERESATPPPPEAPAQQHGSETDMPDGDK